jgi:hypothetical protein
MNPAVFSSRSFSSSLSFVSATAFFVLRHLFGNGESVLLKPKLRKSKNQASVGRQELKIQQAEQMAKKAYQMSSRCALIYTPSALQGGGPRLSLTVAIIAKGRCFFRTFGFRAFIHFAI